jgi:hypothetical protein
VYSPRVTELIEAAKQKLPEFDLVELFKQYFEIANPYIKKTLYLPGEIVPASSRSNNTKTFVTEKHTIWLACNSGDLKVFLEYTNPEIILVDKPTMNGLFIKKTFISKTRASFSNAKYCSNFYPSNKILPEDECTTFQTFLENMIFKPTMVELPEKLVCLPNLQWSESTFTFEFVGNYYCLESEVESEGSKAVIKFSR